MLEKDKDINVQEVEEASEVVDTDPKKAHYDFPWRGFIIMTSIIITLMIVCVIVILLNGGFYQW